MLLHGLFGSHRNWNWHARELAPGFAVYSLDLRNHGDSPHANEMSYPLMADDVLGFLDEQAIESANLLGHSMGGKVAMQLALSQPGRVRRLLVADIAPVTYTESRGDHEQVFAALAALDVAALESRQQADGLLASGIPDARVRQFLLSNLEKESGTGFRWRFNLDALQDNYDRLRDKPVGDGPFEGPVLFVRGAVSNYIVEQDRERILALFPRARLKTIMGAGHWLHAEKAQVFNRIARDFFSSGGQPDDPA